MGSISLREHIKWLPDAASEPTSTIVVTSPGRRFVDLRIQRPEGQEAWAGQKDVLSIDRLEWGIAGTSSSGMREDGKGGQVRHCQWKHWIDSRTTSPETATDEGDMFPQSNGTTLEAGSMVNPATGKETPYEELWRDIQPAPTTTSTVRSIVLHFESESGRGSVVRLGQYCQGLLREGDSLTAERWEYKDNEWSRTIRMGHGVLPCEKVLDDGFKPAPNEVIVLQDRTWKVVETSE